jgi:hypothetical protein
VAAQRIVITSPWKLGLFVFMLVAGTGFGLIYAYMELFGGTFDLKDQEVLRNAYIVLGGVAALGLFGYIAVVTSARPLERVVRGSRQREQLIKRFGKIQDPRMVDIEDFDSEPALRVVLERWAEEAAYANEARISSVSQSEALAQLADQIRECDARDFQPTLEETNPQLDALVDAIRSFAANATDSVAAPASGATPSAHPDWQHEQMNWHQAAEQLFQCEQELEGFVRSVSEHAAEVANRANSLSQNSGRMPREIAMTVEGMRRNGQRMGKIREASILLADEANKLVIGMSATIERSGPAGQEFRATADGLKTLASQYQRIAAELELVENEQETAVRSFLEMDPGALDSSAAQALKTQAMALDQHAEALGELMGRFRAPMETIRDLTPQIDHPPRPQSRPVAKAKARAERAEPVAQAAPEIEPIELDAPAMDRGGDTQEFGMADPGSERKQPSGKAERVYEIAELGGQALDAPKDADDGDRVYDLEELGAVEL